MDEKKNTITSQEVINLILKGLTTGTLELISVRDTWGHLSRGGYFKYLIIDGQKYRLNLDCRQIDYEHEYYKYEVNPQEFRISSIGIPYIKETIIDLSPIEGLLLLQVDNNVSTETSNMEKYLSSQQDPDNGNTLHYSSARYCGSLIELQQVADGTWLSPRKAWEQDMERIEKFKAQKKEIYSEQSTENDAIDEVINEEELAEMDAHCDKKYGTTTKKRSHYKKDNSMEF